MGCSLTLKRLVSRKYTRFCRQALDLGQEKLALAGLKYPVEVRAELEWLLESGIQGCDNKVLGVSKDV